jgi:hypothetical protein
MEKSLPSAAALPDAAPSEATGAQEAKPWRKRRLLRVPTSVLVSVLIAGLSVWVAPALTRQWDDRQKARELRVAIAEEVIAKGTRVIYAATKPPLPGYKPAADYKAMLAQWLEDSAVLKAKLRAYFPKDVGARWETFDESYAQQLRKFAIALPAAAKRHAGETRFELTRYFFRKSIPDDVDRSLVAYLHNMSRSAQDLEDRISTLAATVETRPPKGFDPVSQRLPQPGLADPGGERPQSGH